MSAIAQLRRPKPQGLWIVERAPDRRWWVRHDITNETRTVPPGYAGTCDGSQTVPSWEDAKVLASDLNEEEPTCPDCEGQGEQGAFGSRCPETGRLDVRQCERCGGKGTL